MKQSRVLVLEVLAVSFGSLLFGGLAPAVANASPQEMFAQKCQKCHAVSAYGIEKKAAAGGEAKEEGEEDGGSQSPDLSNTGSFHNVDFLQAYLAKKEKHVAHAGNDSTKKHPSKFKGTDEEQTQLAQWLATLKKEPTAK